MEEDHEHEEDASSASSLPSAPPKLLVNSARMALIYGADTDTPSPSSSSVSSVSSSALSTSSPAPLAAGTKRARERETLEPEQAEEGEIVKKAKATAKKKATKAPKSKSIVSAHMNQLVNKWKGVQKEMEEEEAERERRKAEEAKMHDPLYQRQKRGEMWLETEDEDNPNFVPVGSNWRERVKARKATGGSEES